VIHEHVYGNLEIRVSGTETEARIVAEKRATWKIPHHVFLLSAIMLCMHALSLWAAESRHVATVPALGVQAGGKTGVVHYVILQIDKDPRLGGPTIQFNEIHLGGGSIVSEDWKEGVKQAVTAAARAVGEDEREWMITIKNRSYNALTEGMSASSAIAVGIMAAWRGDDILSDVALTGTITPNGQIESVGAIIIKIEAAARAKFKTILVPHGQTESIDGEIYQLATRWNVRIIEVATLEEAYQLMTRPKH
jgi:predicted ATP-dependent protease